MLLCSPIELRNWVINVFNRVNVYFQKQIIKLKGEDFIAVLVNGASAMLGHITNFLALAKQDNPIFRSFII